MNALKPHKNGLTGREKHLVDYGKKLSTKEVLSPWSIVVDDLLGEITQSGHYVVGYTDNLVILVISKHEDVISSIMQNALNTNRDGVIKIKKNFVLILKKPS